MSTGKTNTSSTQFAAKKLLGKAQTSNLKSDVNEAVPSNVSIPSETIFGEAIPNDPGTAFYTMYSASNGGPATVEQVYFDVVSISDTIYDANDTGGCGDEASNEGESHGLRGCLSLGDRCATDVPNVLRACCSMLHSHKGYHRTAFIGRDHDHEAPFPDDSFGFEHSKGVPLLIPATGRQLLLLSQSRLKMTCSLH